MARSSVATAIAVRYGDRFRCGPHLFQCSDLLAPGEWEGLLKLWRRLHPRTPIGWAYSDPPWNAGNLGYWRTHAGYDPARQEFGRFCERFVECVGMLVPGAAFVEQSAKDPDTLILAAARCPEWPAVRGRWTVSYGSPRRPNLLLRFADHEWAGDPSGMHGGPMTAYVFDREPMAMDKCPVADPCIGLGMTARMAHARGYPCLGNELNPARLARVLGWLSRRGVGAERL